MGSKVQPAKQARTSDVTMATEQDHVDSTAGSHGPQTTGQSHIDTVDDGSSLAGGEGLAEESLRPTDEELAIVDILKSVEAEPTEESHALQTYGVDDSEEMETSRDQPETSGVWSDEVASDTTFFYLSHPKSASDVTVRLQGYPPPHLHDVIFYFHPAIIHQGVYQPRGEVGR